MFTLGITTISSLLKEVGIFVDKDPSASRPTTVGNGFVVSYVAFLLSRGSDLLDVFTTFDVSSEEGKLSLYHLSSGD